MIAVRSQHAKYLNIQVREARNRMRWKGFPSFFFLKKKKRKQRVQNIQFRQSLLLCAFLTKSTGSGGPKLQQKGNIPSSQSGVCGSSNRSLSLYLMGNESGCGVFGLKRGFKMVGKSITDVSPPKAGCSRLEGKPTSPSSPIKATCCFCCCCPSPLGFDVPGGMDEPGEEGLVVDDEAAV